MILARVKHPSDTIANFNPLFFLPFLKRCFRCSRFFIRTGRAFKITCVEGRVVDVAVCRTCARVPASMSVRPVEREERRAA